MASPSLSSDTDLTKYHFNIDKMMKSSPPIKLKRMSFGSVKRTSDLSVTSLSDDLNGCQRTKRLYKPSKILMERSFELNLVLNSVRSSPSDSVTSVTSSTGSSPVSINSHNIKTLISCTDDDLQLKKIDKSESERSNGHSTSKLDVEINLVGLNDSQDLDGSKAREKDEDFEMEPIFAGHQLVGDSQLLRFSQYILGMQRKIDCNGKGWLGLCVGGQRICDLHKRVLDDFIPLAKKLIVLIGTNDLLKGTTGSEMCRGLENLLTTLYKTAEKIIVLTLPPVPKLAYLSEHWMKLEKYNNFIFSLKEYYKEKLDVIDISPLFYHSKLKKCNLGYFELWFDGPVKRPDLIHINESGFKLVRDLLLKEIQ